ncbi:MAG: DNA internalization-related competence protein ComEC/Rec2 [Chloroflexi bacterium]|nr:DNA internalization-related competence protein ComEC/Rec2 [Chloroflexota bacterium]MDA1220069.1 DNA internalization-related competence protein ComEC/Rec2 [Chloroflexota bacterium]
MKLALLAAAWLVGLLLGFQLDVPTRPLLMLGASTLPLALILAMMRRSVWPAILVGVLLLGIWRVEITETPTMPLVARQSQQVTVRGKIADDPEAASRTTRFVLNIDAIDRGSGWQQLGGKSLVYAEPPDSLISSREPPYFRKGDFLTLQGTLQNPEPPEATDDFDYPAYLASQGISGVLWSRQAEWVLEKSANHWTTGWLFDLRQELSQSLESALPMPHSALAQALLLGIRGTLPPDVVQDFRSTGTSHLLAISGMHVGILLVIATGASAWALGRRRQVYLLLPFLGIWMYALLSGLPISVVRAALMGTVYLAVLGLGRPRSALPPLAISALIITALDPLALQQISFQLSFAAMAGIIIALPYQARVSAAMSQWISDSSRWWTVWLNHLAGWLVAALIVSLGATLATLPLVAFNFGRIPLMGIPATIIVLPMLPFILGGSLATAVAGLIHPALGQVVGVAAWVPLSYLLGVVSNSPGPTVSGGWITAPLVWGWYLALGSLLIEPRGWGFLKQLTRRLRLGATSPDPAPTGQLRPTGLTSTVIGVGLILVVANVFLWGQLLSRPDGNLHVYFLNVGQGDSTLIVTPNGRQVLIDGGPASESATTALSDVLPAWDRSLDLVALTHLDADHSRGLLEVMDRYQVEAALVGIQDSTAALYPQWQAVIDRNQASVIKLVAGQRLTLDDGVVLETLHPSASPLSGSPSGFSSNRNNNALVFRLVYQEISFLFTADIEAEAERQLLQSSSDLDSDVLKVAHHGSKTSTTEAFLAAASPSVAVISAGVKNRYGHPHHDVLTRLQQAVGADQVYQTAQQGRIEFITDGYSLWVESQK